MNGTIKEWTVPDSTNWINAMSMFLPHECIENQIKRIVSGQELNATNKINQADMSGGK